MVLTGVIIIIHSYNIITYFADANKLLTDSQADKAQIEIVPPLLAAAQVSKKSHRSHRYNPGSPFRGTYFLYIVENI